MNENEIINASDMITRVFKNLDPQFVNDGNKVISAWRQIIESISNKSINGENIGKNMAAHSRVVDLKNGVLLIEADHPGWIQMLQTHKSYILKGLRMKVPDLKINTLAFRLTGTNYELSKMSEEIQLDKEKKRMEEQLNKQEEILRQRGFDKNENQSSAVKKELPPELKKIFDDLKNDMLTNTK